MSSVDKPKASDEKTSTASEPAESKEVSKFGGLTTEKGNLDAPDDLEHSDQADRPAFDNSASQPISPVSSQGSEKSPTPAVTEFGGESNSLASFQGSEETPSSKETELGGQTIKQTLNVDVVLADVSKPSKEEVLLRELAQQVDKATCMQDVVAAMTGQPFHRIEMWKVLQLVMPHDALLKYKGDILQTEGANRLLIQFGNRKTVQIPTSCLRS